MLLSRDIAAEEKNRAGLLIGFALYIDEPAAFPGVMPQRRYEPTRTGRLPHAALKAARTLARQWGECFVVEQRHDDRGRGMTERVLQRVVPSKA